MTREWLFWAGCAFGIVALVLIVCLLNLDMVSWLLTGSPR